MSRLTWQARTMHGALVRGQSEVTSVADLTEMLSARGLIVTKVTEAAVKRSIAGSRVTLPRKEKILLTQQFTDALGAGIPLVDTLSELTRSYPRPSGRRMLEAIHRHVEGGGALHEGFARFPRVFSPAYVQAVRAAEATGRLDRVFNDLVEQLERENEIAGKVTGALIYPSILLSAAGGVVMLFTVVLLPKLQPLFASAGDNLPLITKIMLSVSNVMRSSWYLILGGIVGSFLSIRFALRTDAGQRLADSLKLRLPLIGGISRRLALSRYTRALEMTFGAGVPLPEALAVSSEASANSVMRKKLNGARDRIMAGHGLADALAATGFFTPLDVRMLAVAEKSGRFEEALSSLSKLHERVARRRIEMTVGLLEPALIMIVGLTVLGLALSIFLPIYQSLDTVGS